MVKPGDKLNLEIWKITASKDGNTRITLQHPLADNYPTLVFSPYNWKRLEKELENG